MSSSKKIEQYTNTTNNILVYYWFLPWRDFVYKYCRDGRNLISTLACNHQNWPEERTFANFIEVIKNILGCSFGTVLRHSRVLEPNKEKMSPEMVQDYKQQLEQLGKLA